MGHSEQSSKFPTQYRSLPEALLWAVGIVAMALMEPEGEHLFSLCPLRWLDFHFCPGCGLGHAIAYLFRGELEASWAAHPLGLPALLVLGWRVISLVKHSLFLRSFYLKTTLKHG